MLLNIPKGKKYKQINLDLSLILYTKINSKGILDLNVKHAAIKLLGKQIKKKKNLWDLELGKEFLDLTPKVQFIKWKN